MPEQVKFKKPKPNFQSILKKQKEMEDDEKFAISDSLQEYIDTIGKKAGYQNQEKLEKANIRQEVINFVDNYTISSLDSIKGMEYDDALQLQSSTEKSIAEIEGTGQLNEAELDFIRATVGETNTRLKEVLKLSTRLKFAFRDLKKELKPLKLAARVGLTRIPILGKRIERAIRAEEEGESEALRIKRGLRKREARDTRKMGDTSFPAPNDQSQTQQNKTIAKQTTAGIMATDNKSIPKGDREELVEEERESDAQFETTSGTLERILEETELTNELLGGKGKKGAKDDKDGFSILEVLGMKKLYDFVKAGRVATLVANLGALSVTAGVFAAAAAAGFGLGKLIEKIGMSNVGEEETKEVKRQSADITSSSNFEGVLAEDIEAENALMRDAQLKDEYNRGIKANKLPKDMTFEQYKTAKSNAGITRELKFEGFMGTNLFKDANLVKADADYGSIRAQFSEDQVNSMIIPPSVKANTEGKIETANTIQADGVEKGSTIVNNSQNSGNTVINNQNNVDASNTQNKTDYGSTTIGTGNTHYPDYY
jgi:hypothetical protein|tara:strand:- start:2199 stop:3821 length:1623 start_codon:yes stop_codon:yes gene_type:complete